jgi:hypothetical protein
MPYLQKISSTLTLKLKQLRQPSMSSLILFERFGQPFFKCMYPGYVNHMVLPLPILLISMSLSL